MAGDGRIPVEQLDPRTQPDGMYGLEVVDGVVHFGDQTIGHYRHTQSAAAASWSFNHGLNKYPSLVILCDSDSGEPCDATVDYVDLNNVIITFPSAESGTVDCN